ncbi:MAG TPA: hypothetical protein VKB88_24985 [Bryobacteraceae bacterium]|nr:hypothetical protein [Bryobacteraceae bacterium]
MAQTAYFEVELLVLFAAGLVLFLWDFFTLLVLELALALVLWPALLAAGFAGVWAANETAANANATMAIKLFFMVPFLLLPAGSISPAHNSILRE